MHGIRDRDIVGAPEWPNILERLVTFAQGLPLVAHNASFERSVIVQTSQLLGLPVPDFAYLCTVELAKAADPGAPNHKLDTLAARYGIEQHSHHDAGEDAYVGAQLALALLDRASHAGSIAGALLR